MPQVRVVVDYVCNFGSSFRFSAEMGLGFYKLPNTPTLHKPTPSNSPGAFLFIITYEQVTFLPLQFIDRWVVAFLMEFTLSQALSPVWGL